MRFIIYSVTKYDRNIAYIVASSNRWASKGERENEKILGAATEKDREAESVTTL